MTPEQVRAIALDQVERAQEYLDAACQRRHERANERAAKLEQRLESAGLTTTETRERVARLETLVASVNDTISEVRDEQRDARAQGRRTQWFVITTLVGVVVTLALKLAAGL